jgi:hypothetical protein
MQRAQRTLSKISDFSNTLCLLLAFAGFLLDLFFDPEDGRSVLLRNVGKRLPDYTVSHPRR